MSEKLLQQFIQLVDEEDGVAKKVKKRQSAWDKNKDHVKKLIRAAARGEVELPEEEKYIAEAAPKDDVLDERIAQQGYSLVEQMRDYTPRDLAKRNLNYVNYLYEKGRHQKKAEKILRLTKKPSTSKSVRKIRAEITGLREPKPGAKKTKKSVFTDKDFAALKNTRIKAVDLNDLA